MGGSGHPLDEREQEILRAPPASGGFDEDVGHRSVSPSKIYSRVGTNTGDLSMRTAIDSHVLACHKRTDCVSHTIAPNVEVHL